MIQRTVGVVVAACTSLFALAGCAAEEVAADCQLQLRADGAEYTSYGYTAREAVRHGTAEQASCDDVGEEARGSVFAGGDQVGTWTFAGYEPGEVLGVRFDASSFAVYVADTVAADERDRIYEELGPAEPQ